jgi:hypothetical protein
MRNRTRVQMPRKTRYYGANATGRISDLHVRDTHSYYATSEAGRDPVLSIRLYEDRINQARANLAHVNAAIKIFEASVEVETMGRYVDVYRLYKRGEQIILCKEGLASGPKSTGELALFWRKLWPLSLSIR